MSREYLYLPFSRIDPNFFQYFGGKAAYRQTLLYSRKRENKSRSVTLELNLVPLFRSDERLMITVLRRRPYFLQHSHCSRRPFRHSQGQQ
ncbi:hypothetical protein M404DRAFT_1009429 [Pisolithus tinctorius Marx 270]|uniref:Uncharacterized protein n=1 Tax=Pisolithus tinctorius Marx 270 TaxID=870435 RepID=A0A0C3J4P5_PISTI|nr:hypothetical protein M404DRAFT_1009429 [Pisolithus tinctorius Marx 270]